MGVIGRPLWSANINKRLLAHRSKNMLTVCQSLLVGRPLMLWSANKRLLADRYGLPIRDYWQTVHKYVNGLPISSCWQTPDTLYERATFTTLFKTCGNAQVPVIFNQLLFLQVPGTQPEGSRPMSNPQSRVLCTFEPSHKQRGEKEMQMVREENWFQKI